ITANNGSYFILGATGFSAPQAWSDDKQASIQDYCLLQDSAGNLQLFVAMADLSTNDSCALQLSQTGGGLTAQSPPQWGSWQPVGSPPAKGTILKSITAIINGAGQYEIFCDASPGNSSWGLLHCTQDSSGWTPFLQISPSDGVFTSAANGEGFVQT